MIGLILGLYSTLGDKNKVIFLFKTFLFLFSVNENIFLSYLNYCSSLSSGSDKDRKYNLEVFRPRKISFLHNSSEFLSFSSQFPDPA